MFVNFPSFLLFNLFQLSKKEIWRSHSSRSDRARLFSIVLDDELTHGEPEKDNRFVYSFVHYNISSAEKKLSDGSSLNVTSSTKKDLDRTLKSGDYVVWLTFTM